MGNETIFLSQLLLQWKCSRKSYYALTSLLLVFLLAYNSFTVIFTQIHFPSNTSPEKTSFLPENVNGGQSRNKNLSTPSSSSEKSPELNTHLSLLHKNANLAVSNSRTSSKRKRRRHKRSSVKIVEKDANRFESRAADFFESSGCELRFFMTWISPLESFGEREKLCMESLFRAHPRACLMIVSSTLDSRNGMRIFKPFLDKGFRVTSVSPDFDFLFKNTAAQRWYDRLKRGSVNPGHISLGQNLSNLLRFGLLYRFGGIYLDTDVVILKSFRGLSNVIGAQTIDLVTGRWTRLNNAVMIFDRAHPLLRDFIEEFALTFDGNKWGHNGPYLVSRVVSRVSGRAGYNFTIMPPSAFYPVDWRRIGGIFRGPKGLSHSKWIVAKLRQLRSRSFAVHLWNKWSRELVIEHGSIVHEVVLRSCVFCNNINVSSLLPVV